MGIALTDIAIWWLVLEIIGFASLPIASAFCRSLKDNGYSISKPLGLLLLTYISWIISVFAGYSYFSVLLSLGIIGTCSLIIYFLKGKPAFNKKYTVYFELLFAGAFVVFAVIRAYSPDIYWTGGEKFMDMAFINSLLRTTEFPPLDPWMSGTVVQYYYFGYLIVANLIRISAILPSVAFNLATASFFALAFTTALGIGYNLSGRIKYGIITAFFVTIAGNLVGFLQLLDILWKGDVVHNILSFDYWTSSRVIPNTINEFPFFSFLQGDVHAHMMSIVFQLLIMLLLLNIMKSKEQRWDSIFILGLSIGFLYPLNTWDYPVYLFLAIIVIVFHFLKDAFSGTKKEVLKPIFAIVAVSVLSYILYLPYHNSYKLERTVSIITSGRTPLIFYMAIYGLFLYLIYRFVILKSRKSGLKSAYFLITLILLSILTILLKFELLILLIPILLLCIVSIIKEQNRDHVFVLILLITGTLISLFSELFYIPDALGNALPPYFRMNTVFKLYMINWVLWGISAGAIVFQFRDSFSRKKTWGIVAVLLILMVSVYPVLATIGKSGGFKGEPNLDGEAYVKNQHPQEYMAILWFRNITGQPVVLQAPGELYKWNTYITTFTGLPTVMGWYWHELDWRYPQREEIDARWSDVNRMYTSSNLIEVSSLLRKYNVSYIYFGEAELKRYSSPRLFESHPERFEKVFEYGDIVVYKFKPDR